MAELPRGTVAFLFTDVEGSTRLWQTHHEAMTRAYERHDAILRGAAAAHGGAVYKVIGDAYQVAFPTAPAAVAAARWAQRGLAAEDWAARGLPEPLRVRMALHAGAVNPDPDGDYRSPVLNRLGRLLGAAHGGQVLLSQAAFELARDHLPEGTGLRDLGDQRLKDLFRPERVFQLLHPDLPADFPPLATLERRPNNLPIQPTPFVGREGDAADVVALLRRKDVRLVTLTGPGGVGKTRLSLQVAADLLDTFADGCWFVDLAAIRDPALLVSAVAEVLGVMEDGGRSLGEVLVDRLREQALLLILDNFEQLTEAAPQVASLLASAPELKVLVTSRAVLHLRAEREFPVPPLTLPDPRTPSTADQLCQYEAVRLFIERAVAVRPDFTVDNENAPAVAEICRRLDGLPLAIELAAARVKIFPPEQLLRRLEKRLPMLTGGARDLPARQRTLRDAIAWSLDLMNDEERALFRRLAVFAGGATFEAAEAVATGTDTASASDHPPSRPLDVFELLASLVDKSLLRQAEGPDGEPRFILLETIREFALEQLAAAGEEPACRRAFVEFALSKAESAEAEFRGPGEAAALLRLDAENANLREALSWALVGQAPELALRFGAALWHYWEIRGLLTEGRAFLVRALADSEAHLTAARASALYGMGALAEAQNDYAHATEAHRAGLSLCQQLDDQRGVMRALNGLGNVAIDQGDLAAAEELYGQVLALAREVGDRWRATAAAVNLGNIALHRMDLSLAGARYEEALVYLREVGDRHAVCLVLSNLGVVAQRSGDWDRAEKLYEEASALSGELGDAIGRANSLTNVAGCLEHRGEVAEAIARYEEALRLFREVGNRRGEAIVLFNLGLGARQRANYQGALRLVADCIGLFANHGNTADVADSLEAQAGSLALAGRPEAAARLLGAAEALRQEIAVTFHSDETYEETVAAVRAVLGEAGFAAAWAAGRALTLEQAVAETAALAGGPTEGESDG